MISLDSLAARVEPLERANRRLRWLLGLGCALVCGLATLAWREPPLNAGENANGGTVDKLNVGTLIVRDAKGRARVTISARGSKEGEGAIIFLNGDNKGQAFLRETKNGLTIDSYDGNAKKRLTIAPDTMVFYDAAERLRSMFALSEKNGGGLEFTDENGKRRSLLSQAGLLLRDESEHLRMALTQFPEIDRDPALVVMGSDGNVHFSSRGVAKDLQAPAPTATPAAEPKEAAAARKLKNIRVLVDDKNFDRARERLRELIRDFPHTKAADEAQSCSRTSATNDG